uniref:Uncharacterized protein n=1 Tax=Hemiselmis tepida TaxID=464990 RepID=A0A7S0VR47_9CRYP|mmetsp:Transcript_21207/g.53356  ORF Transcript_21207/g.53356 Transcript_21207/m.53356 type:complete len:174 (+) Transcript_21207:213-734(+)
MAVQGAIRRALMASPLFAAVVAAPSLCESSSPAVSAGKKEVQRHTRLEKVEDYVKGNPSIMSVAAICFPNAFMLWNHYKGRTKIVVNFVLRHFGVYGLFAVPFIGMALEKSFYDTAMSIQGINPCTRSPERQHEGFPSGGHALPSLSMVAVMNPTLSDILFSYARGEEPPSSP